jgi:hypothetical protein
MCSGVTGFSGALADRLLDWVKFLLLFLRGLFTTTIYPVFKKSTVFRIVLNAFLQQQQNHAFQTVGTQAEIAYKMHSSVIDFKHDVSVEVLVLKAGDEDAAVARIHQNGPKTRISLGISLEYFPNNKSVVAQSFYKITGCSDLVFGDGFFVHLIRHGTT